VVVIGVVVVVGLGVVVVVVGVGVVVVVSRGVVVVVVGVGVVVVVVGVGVVVVLKINPLVSKHQPSVLLPAQYASTSELSTVGSQVW
jgi:hypothetical protein